MRCFFTKVITVERLTSADGKEGYTAHGTITGYIAPLSAQEAFVTEGNPAQQFKLVTDINSDIKKTDRLTYNGQTFIVTGTQKHEFGAMRRLEANLDQYNS